MEAGLKQLKEYGMETLYLYGGIKADYKNGKLTNIDLSNVRKMMKLYRKLGFTENRILWNTAWQIVPLANKLTGNKWKPTEPRTITPEFKYVYQQIIKEIDKEAKKNNWPIIYYGVVLSDGFPFSILGPAAKLSQGIGVKTWCQTINPDVFKKLYSMTDLCIGSRGVWNHLDRDFLKKGKEVGSSNIPYTASIPENGGLSSYRFWYGFWFWRTGMTLISTENCNCWYGEPYNPFDGSRPENGIIFPTPDGFAATLSLEALREGRDDYRYIDLLQQLIEQSPKRKKVKEAKEILKMIKQDISPIPSDYIEGRKKWWNPKQYNCYRWLIAKKIMELEGKFK